MWTDGSGNPVYSDRQNQGYKSVVDSTNNLVANQTVAFVQGSNRVYQFQRLMDTGDSQDMVIQNANQNWLFAWSRSGPGSSSPSATTW